MEYQLQLKQRINNMGNGIGTYDANFSLYDLAKSSQIKTHKRASHLDTEVARNTSFGESIYDKSFFPNVTLNVDGKGDNLEQLITENRAQYQPWVTKAGAGVARIGAKALTEIAKMPGVLGGIAVGAAGQAWDVATDQDNTDFMQTAFNNPWINSLNDINESINQELLPVYVKKAVQEGNLWANISSIDFWATEGADGLGYILSMLAPGALINKANLGAKMFGIGQFAKMTDKMDDAVKIMGGISLTPRNANLITSTIANTLFEAGAEAQGGMERFKQELDMQLESGEITQTEYESQLLRQSEVGRNIFIANAAILIGPNAMMAKMLWGKPRNRGMKLSKTDGGIGFNEVAEYTLKDKAKIGAKALGIGTLQEGFWEEGMQSTAEQYFVEQGHKKSKGFISEFGDYLGDLPKSYAEMISETEGQKAIFLGAVFGGGMTAYHDRKSSISERLTTNDIVKQANESLNGFYDTFRGDTFKENPDTDDLASFIAKMRGFQGIETLNDLYNIALKEGDTNTLETIRDIASTQLVKPFIINDQLGLDALKQHLDASKELITISEQEKDVTVDKIIDGIMEKATKLKDVYNNYNDFAPTLLDLKHKNATERDKSSFYNKLADSYVNAKATQFQLQNELKEQNNGLDKLLKEKGKTRAELESNPLLANELNSDTRIVKVKESIKETSDLVEEANKEVDKFWEKNNIQKEFNKAVEGRELLEKEMAKTKEVDEVIDKIKVAKTSKEVDDISVPEGLSKEYITNLKLKRKAELQIEKDLQDNATKNSNDEFDQQSQLKEEDTLNELEYIKENYNVGEAITIDPNFKLGKQFNGKTGIIKSISKNGVTVTIEGENKSVTISLSSLTKVHHDNNINYESEGGNPKIIQLPTEDLTSGETFEKTGGSRIMSSDNKGGVLFGNQAALDFEQSPVDKVGQEKKIVVNQGNVVGETTDTSIFTENQKQALEMFNAGDLSQMSFLIDHLPLSVELSEGVIAPLETKSDKSEGVNTVFNKSTRLMRTTIIKEMVNNGTKLSQITIPIEGQWNGTLQISPLVNGQVVENSLLGLYQYGQDIKNIKSSDFYMVSDFGILTNNEGKTFPTTKSKSNAKGEIYLLINMANGKPFPLKLNVKKISEEKSDVLYDLYNYLFDAPIKNKSTRLSDLEDKTIISRFEENFKEEIQLFKANNKSLNRLTVGDIIDLMVWSSTKNVKSQIRFDEKNNILLLTDETFTKEEFNTPEGKERFIDNLSNNKRHQIRFKKRPGDTAKSMNFLNRSYVEYLINNGILNTNAVINQPTFQGRTSVYLATRKVKVDGKDSIYNQPAPLILSDKLIGNNKQLTNQLPGLFENPIVYDKKTEEYIDPKDKKKKFVRVSNLKDAKKVDSTQLNIYNAAKRGDVTDELTRQFFSNKFMTKNDFVKHGEKEVDNVNKNKPNSVIIIHPQFFEQLYDILESYKVEFNKRNYTVYANTPPLSGTLGGTLYAGTADLLAYDNTKKEWIYIDIKTSSTHRGAAYKGKDVWDYKAKDAIQQNAYRELFAQKNSKTGTTIKTLLILPLTAVSLDKGLNSEYDSISIDSTTKDNKFLTVSTEKDIYQLKNIKKGTVSKPKVEKGTPEVFPSPKPSKKINITDPNFDPFEDIDFNEETEDFDENDFGVAPSDMLNQANDLMEAFGIEIPEAKPKPSITKKVSSTTTSQALTSDQQLELQKELSKPANVFEVKYKGSVYMITKNSFYVLDLKKKVPVTDIGMILNIITEYNTKVFKDAKIDKEKVRNIWNSRKNVVSLPITTKKTTVTTKKTTVKPKVEVKPIKKVDTMNFNKLTDGQATSIIMTLMEKVPGRIGDITKILDDNTKTVQEQLKSLYSLLENNDIARNIIETKCK